MPDVIELGQKVKAKYPGSYDGMDDADVGRKVKAKYPGSYDQFEDTVQMSVAPKTPQAAVPEQQKKGVGGLLGGVVGFAKEAIDLPRKAAEFGYNLGTKASEKVFGASNGQSGVQRALSHGVERPEITKTHGTAEKLGAGVEQVAEFFLPVPGASKLKAATQSIRAAKEAPALLRAVAAVARPLARAGIEGVESSAKSAVQQGDMEGFGKEAGAQSLMSLGLSGASKAAKGAGNLALQVLGKTTGVQDDALRLAFENPEVMRVARKAGKGGGVSDVMDSALRDARTGLQKIRDARGSEYRTALMRLKGERVDYGEILDDAKNRTKELFDEFDVRTTKGGLIGPRSFRDSAIEQGKPSVEKAYRTLRGWKDTTPAGLDKLKKKLSQFRNSVRNSSDGSYALIRGMMDRVDEGLKVNVRGYSEMTSKYRQASELIEDIEKSLSLGDKASKDASMSKLMSTLRQNKEFRREMLGILSGKSGSDISAKIAGATLSPLAPRGIAGAIGPGIGGASFLANPSSWPLLLAGLASSSPRLVGEAVSIMGRMRGRIPTPEITRALQGLVSQAMRADDDEEKEGRP